MLKSLPKKTRQFVLFIIAVFVILLPFGINYLIFLNYERDIKLIQVQNLDLNTVADGEYFGDCDVDLVGAKVRVVVKNNKIMEIELIEHKNDRGAMANSMPEKIIREQRLDVDSVSGATASSKVIQEAVYNALTGKRTIRN